MRATTSVAPSCTAKLSGQMLEGMVTSVKSGVMAGSLSAFCAFVGTAGWSHAVKMAAKISADMMFLSFMSDGCV